MARFALELLRAAKEARDSDTILSVSCTNELITELRRLSAPLFEVDTFFGTLGLFTGMWRLPLLRRRLRKLIIQERIEWVVNLMPHVWTPLVVSAVQDVGCRFATIIHDAKPHPGDPSGIALTWCNREALAANRVLTLSKAVRRDMLNRWPRLAEHTTVLFPPNMAVSSRPPQNVARRDDTPFQVLFFGRILPYKGLPLLTEAVEILAHRGFQIHLHVLGSGDLQALRPRLEALNAKLDIGWFSDDTLADALAQTNAVALSHTEASQSGVASVAAAAGVPAVATPVGALGEQVRDGQEGVLATAATPTAFADAIERLIRSPDLERSIRQNLADQRDSRSMHTFLNVIRKNLAAGDVAPDSSSTNC